MQKKKLNLVSFLGKYGIVVVLIVLIVFFSVTSKQFLAVSNIINILRQVAVVGIMSVGMTMVLITGGIDLSVGSVAGVACVSTALLMNKGLPWAAAVLLVLIVSCALGGINGFCINALSIPPLITTLGMMTALRGTAYLLTGGLPVFGFPKDILFLGKGSVAGIPVPVIIMAVIFVIGILFMDKTRYGVYIYGVGGNEEATRLSGINVKKIKYLVYMASATLAGLAGIVLLARVNSGQPKAGDGYEMDVITAVVLGGVSISGGEGSMPFVIIGVLFMGVLSNGMVMLNIQDYTQQVVKGIALLLAVAFDRYMQNKKAKQVE